uniref:Uncharacterized protein n=1 Tax=Oryza rufipogon TaxID=4529 RepID=A0A0E0PI13_ORYRU
MAGAGLHTSRASSDGLTGCLSLPPKLLHPAPADRDDNEEYGDEEDAVLVGIIRRIPCAFDNANHLLSCSPAATIRASRHASRLLSFSPTATVIPTGSLPLSHHPLHRWLPLSPLPPRHSRESGEKRREKGKKGEITTGSEYNPQQDDTFTVAIVVAATAY